MPVPTSPAGVTEDGDFDRQMPRYKSHKHVYALEIESLDGHEISFLDDGFRPIVCAEAMFSRYVPVPGDFYVVYEDGYKSFSPRKAFLEGYTRA